MTMECATLEKLVVDLEAAERELSALPDTATDEDIERVYGNQHWPLREAINDIPASGLDNLRLQARAAQIALAHDAGATSEGPGSFVELAKLVINSLVAMEQPASA
jgi:hypothetical protein